MSALSEVDPSSGNVDDSPGPNVPARPLALTSTQSVVDGHDSATGEERSVDDGAGALDADAGSNVTCRWLLSRDVHSLPEVVAASE